MSRPGPRSVLWLVSFGHPAGTLFSLQPAAGEAEHRPDPGRRPGLEPVGLLRKPLLRNSPSGRSGTPGDAFYRRLRRQSHLFPDPGQHHDGQVPGAAARYPVHLAWRLRRGRHQAVGARLDPPSAPGGGDHRRGAEGVWATPRPHSASGISAKPRPLPGACPSIRTSRVSTGTS